MMCKAQLKQSYFPLTAVQKNYAMIIELQLRYTEIGLYRIYKQGKLSMMMCEPLRKCNNYNNIRSGNQIIIFGLGWKKVCVRINRMLILELKSRVIDFLRGRAETVCVCDRYNTLVR